MQIFYEKTLAFQSGRETPWTIFAQVPELKVLQQVLTAAVILLAFVVPVVLKKRTIRRLAALSAALVIAFELTVNYWFYPYVTWFEPFVFVALLLANNEKTALDRESDRQENAQPSAASDQRKAG
jgi:glycerol-3-phosphate acyltransferase PlsY